VTNDQRLPISDGRGVPTACWNILSVIAPFAGVALGALAVAVRGSDGDSLGFRGVAVFIFTFLASTAFGFAAAVVARRRREQRPVLTTLGLWLNGVPTFGLGILLFIP